MNGSLFVSCLLRDHACFAAIGHCWQDVLPPGTAGSYPRSPADGRLTTGKRRKLFPDLPLLDVLEPGNVGSYSRISRCRTSYHRKQQEAIYGSPALVAHDLPSRHPGGSLRRTQYCTIDTQKVCCVGTRNAVILSKAKAFSQAVSGHLTKPIKERLWSNTKQRSLPFPPL